MSSLSIRAEARTRYYTRDEALRIGWDVSHPDKGGFFLEEQEILNKFPRLKPVLGQQRPDFGLLASDRQLRGIIECKGNCDDLDTAIAEAQDYANTINRVQGFDVRIAVGVAGTPDKFVKTRGSFLVKNRWVPLASHGYELTQLPTIDELQRALHNGNGTTEVQLPDEREFFDAAIRISRILRLAKVEEAERPRVIGSIILALYRDNFSMQPDVVLSNININVEAAVRGFPDMPADSRETLRKTLTLRAVDDQLCRKIPEIVSQLERLNVRSIMRSGVDFLGQFYETFLRYGQDTKKLGIVFTPRHITKLCAELADVQTGMTVYDPACGTGGFLVAAFDRMMQHATTARAKERVRTSLYGYDTNATVWALAVLNMFFRGDGKSHIKFGSCFEKTEVNLFDRALLNPPFSQDEEAETDFIDHALQNLEAGGIMAVVVKTSVMVDPELAGWRRELVARHQVLAVISLPAELFYPTAAPCVILVVRVDCPDLTQGTFLAQIVNDGFRISKKRRVKAPEGDQIPRVKALYEAFLREGTMKTVPNLACVIPRASVTGATEICAEQWLPSAKFGMTEYETARHFIMQQMTLAIANSPDITDEIIPNYERLLAEGETQGKPSRRAPLADWFDISNGASDGKSGYPGGTTPYISSGDSFNGIVELVTAPEEEVYSTPCITVSAFGQASLQPWKFCARGNGGSAVRVLQPRFSMKVSELMWMVGQINAQRWRFHYGRMATMHRLRGLEVDAPSHELPESMDLEAKLRNFRRGLRVMTDGESGGTTVEQRFRAMKEKWLKERGPASAISRLAMHPAYQQIIGMGEAVIPLIMAELERKPDHWFWALNAITGANPVHKSSQGKITKMAEDWLKWGRDQGFTW